MSNTSFTFYTGVTNDIYRRVGEHKNHLFPKSFTSRYNITKLVYFEFYESSEQAIQREKYLKRRSRKEKFELIQSQNPKCIDLYSSLGDILS